jgi:AraC-like DNA-binding protein
LFNKRNLACGKDIEVFMTVNDLIAQNLVSELHAIGISVPNDAAVVGFNNQFSSIRSYPPITTVDPNYFQIGYQSVVTLLSLITKKEKPADYRMPCKLILRASCGCHDNAPPAKRIKDASYDNKSFESVMQNNQETIILRIKEAIVNYDKRFDAGHTRTLFDSFMKDMFAGGTDAFVSAFKHLFIDQKSVTEEKLIVWQNIVSDMRTIFLTYCIDNADVSLKAENIFNQTRVMIDAAYTYMTFSRKSDIYKTGALVKIATDFNEADDLEKIIKLIKVYVDELEIPGIYVSLYKEPGKDIGKGYMALMLNKDHDIVYTDDSESIPSGMIIPRSYISEAARVSTIFEILHYNNIYLGYVLFEMDSASLPMYDSLRTIVSPSLYRALIGKKSAISVKGNKYLSANQDLIRKYIRTENIEDSKIETATEKNILEYLLIRIDTPTDLESISYDFRMSVSTISRKTKKLTGYSIQKLHELLKTEKAKYFLEMTNLSILEISKKLGYKNQYYFSSVFKKCAGMSPKKWIKQH